MPCCVKSCCGPGSYCCVNADQHIHRGDDVLFDFDWDCLLCQHDRHFCPGCGSPAGHSGEVRRRHDPTCVSLDEQWERERAHAALDHP